MRFDASRSRSYRAMKRVCNRVLKLAGIRTCDTGPCRAGFRIRCDNQIVNGDEGEEGEIDQSVAEESETEEEEASSGAAHNDNREYDHFDFIWRLIEDTKSESAAYNDYSSGPGGSARYGGDGGFHGAEAAIYSSSEYCTVASNGYAVEGEEEVSGGSYSGGSNVQDRHRQGCATRCGGGDGNEGAQRARTLSRNIIAVPPNVAETHYIRVNSPLNVEVEVEVEEGWGLEMEESSSTWKGSERERERERERETEEEALCPVCLEALSLNSPLIWRLPCGHGFHVGCLWAWIGQQQRCPFCPCCRAPIPTPQYSPDPPPPPPPPDATSLFDHVESALAHLLRFL